MHKPNSRILNFLIILALFTAGISPACKFISGQASFIEICSATGMKTIAVPADKAPFQQRKNDSDHKDREQCAFCFAFAKVKILKTAPVIIAYAPDRLGTFSPQYVSPVVQAYAPGHVSSRGPPLFS